MNQKVCLATCIALALTAPWLLCGCDAQEIEQKHANLQQEIAKISDKFDERMVLAGKLEKLITTAGCKKERGYLLHLDALRKKISLEKFDSEMTSRVLVRGYQDVQDSLGSTIRLLAYDARNCLHSAAKANELAALSESISANNDEIAKLYTQINSSIQAYNVLISVPPTSWENKLFFHYMVMHPWLITN